MAKNSIRDYSATNSSNTDIQSIDISEGCSPAGINNAIREVMADLKDVSTGAVALESPAFDSASLTGNLTFGDNDKAIFGAGSDLQIYHSGLHSYVDDAGTGDLRLRGNAGVYLGKYTGESMVDAIADGAVTLYYDNAAKLATTATGVDVTGTVTADGLTVDGSFRQTGATAPFEWTVNAGATDYYKLNSVGYSDNIIVATAAGNVGIGTSNPLNKFIVAEGTNQHGVEISPGTTSYIQAYDRATSDYGDLRIDAQTIAFATDNGTERMRIDSSGRVGVGVTPSSGFKFKSSSSGTSGVWAGYFHGRDYAKSSRLDTSGYADFFYTPTSYAGYIYVDTTSNTTTYASSSDYRLKTAVTYDWDATSRLKQLKPARFKWISAGDDAVPVDGFLAHEVSHDSEGNPLVPEAIVGEKDAMRDEEYTVSAATGDIYTPAIEATFDEDGNEVTEATDEVIHSTDVERPDELTEGQQWRETTAAVMGTRSVPDYQGIDQSKLVPLLVKTIQELEARITALEAN